MGATFKSELLLKERRQLWVRQASFGQKARQLERAGLSDNIFDAPSPRRESLPGEAAVAQLVSEIEGYKAATG